ncbi:glycosyltransferase [Pseudanabaena sp. ABRG5-3]|uniref:glycosyltransferase n=1 Tax=Pseudanabaena sp. ABRG5-3 TaxID=685565 RepID=UPI000DC724F0|nr:glycosyltransferase [Pseudanabaena sp. ABRG5-3]BBC22544.1 hypothetical protein ABRG53_0287 [Pseudanabaena sp. ABRG5-3]
MLNFLWSGYVLYENSYSIYEFSNLEIPKWAEYYLSQKDTFHQSSCLFGRITNNVNDILIGHPTWHGNNGIDDPIKGKSLRNWVKDNAIYPQDLAHPNTYILMPWVPEFPQEWKMPWINSQLLQSQKIFALCGEIWMERTLAKQDNSIQFNVRDKLVHCNMGLAAQNFSIHKTSFNPIGDRQLLHISNLGTYKGFDVTCRSLVNVEALLHVASSSFQAPVGMVKMDLGDDDIFLFNFLGTINNNDPETNAWIVENCDFYIHTATMDAQATTILENCARGLIPLITPESGFSSPHAIYLTHDPHENHKIIEWALNLPEEDLLKRSELLREQIVREHNWENIFGKIWDVITEDVESRKIKSQP